MASLGLAGKMVGHGIQKVAHSTGSVRPPPGESQSTFRLMGTIPCGQFRLTNSSGTFFHQNVGKKHKIQIMNTLEIKGDWNIIKGKLKQKWSKLTDNDLSYTKGQQEELVGRIQKLTGETRQVVENAIKDSCAECGVK
jgi:uncharacterized protein YjbJ (UPF0337 family)